MKNQSNLHGEDTFIDNDMAKIEREIQKWERRKRKKKYSYGRLPKDPDQWPMGKLASHVCAVGRRLLKLKLRNVGRIFVRIAKLRKGDK